MKLSRSLGASLLILAGAAMPLPGQPTDADRKDFGALKARADKGDVDAELSVANRYKTGDGVTRDLAKAVKYTRKAAEQGSARAQCLLALMYSNGDGVKVDLAEAARWFYKAANQGLAEAQYNLGMCYARGEGVAKNAVWAVEWYRKAAAQNLPEAMCDLGNCYLEGNGVPTDIPEGIKWTRQAAEMGFGSAQNTLGLCYAKGRGVPKDLVEAYKWFNLAAGQGGELANEAKIGLAMSQRTLTPEQVADGQRRAREFKPGKAPAPSQSLAQPGKTNSTPATTSAQTTSPAAATSTDSTFGVVNVKADDDTCEIFVDGAFVGNTPAKVKLMEGAHAIVVRKAGCKDYQRLITITGGSELTLRAVLEKQ
jgi:TPR repeat protein